MPDLTRRTRPLALIAAALLLAGCVETTRTATISTISIAAPQSNVTQLVNAQRRAAGQAPVSRNARLDGLAQSRAAEMLRTGNYGHTDARGRGNVQRVAASGCQARGTGENIAWGQRTTEIAMSGWMSSPGHRRNIRYPNWRVFGYGEAGGVHVMVFATGC